MRVQYVADDGTIFAHEVDCRMYENSTRNKLIHLIESSCDSMIDQIRGTCYYYTEDIADFIIAQLADINDIVNPPKF